MSTRSYPSFLACNLLTSTRLVESECPTLRVLREAKARLIPQFSQTTYFTLLLRLRKICRTATDSFLERERRDFPKEWVFVLQQSFCSISFCVKAICCTSGQQSIFILPIGILIVVGYKYIAKRYIWHDYVFNRDR